MRTWHVYRLLDPRSYKPFYIGCSVDPVGRAKHHAYDYCSSRERCREIKAAGLEVLVIIVSSHTDKLLALKAEWSLIISTLGLVNVARHEPVSIGNLR